MAMGSIPAAPPAAAPVPPWDDGPLPSPDTCAESHTHLGNGYQHFIVGFYYFSDYIFNIQYFPNFFYRGFYWISNIHYLSLQTFIYSFFYVI